MALYIYTEDLVANSGINRTCITKADCANTALNYLGESIVFQLTMRDPLCKQ
jgi:hypothetical protein